MSGLEPFSPDADYCVYCHAPAAGMCAECGALCCVDCVELVMGLDDAARGLRFLFGTRRGKRATLTSALLARRDGSLAAFATIYLMAQ